MQFTATQMATFGQHATAEFMGRALAYLCSKHAELCERVGTERVKMILQRSLERCNAHQADSESCVVTLADLSLSCARDVYVTDGWVQDILSSEHIDGSEKALRLKSYL